MVETIAPTFALLKKNFRTQATKKYEWREKQLKALLQCYTEMRPEIEEALFQDLGRNAHASAGEYKMIQGALDHDLKHLKSYMKDVSTESELLLAPASTYIRYEPLGVVAIFSAWNYPIMTAMKPLVQCITTGNAVIMKPSEIAPHVSRVIKKMIEKCLDQDFIRCIEGGIDVAVELNK